MRPRIHTTHSTHSTHQAGQGQKELDSEFDLDISSISVKSAKQFNVQEPSVLNLSCQGNEEVLDKDNSNNIKNLSSFFNNRIDRELTQVGSARSAKSEHVFDLDKLGVHKKNNTP